MISSITLARPLQSHRWVERVLRLSAGVVCGIRWQLAVFAARRRQLRAFRGVSVVFDVQHNFAGWSVCVQRRYVVVGVLRSKRRIALATMAVIMAVVVRGCGYDCGCFDFGCSVL